MDPHEIQARRSEDDGSRWELIHGEEVVGELYLDENAERETDDLCNWTLELRTLAGLSSTHPAPCDKPPVEAAKVWVCSMLDLD